MGKSIVSLGNVLLDIIAPVGEDFLAKYGLQPESTTIAQQVHLPIFETVQGGEFYVQYSAGGSASNTARVAQWILRSAIAVGATASATIFVGAVGDDAEGGKLVDLLEKVGIIVKCQRVSNEPTGRCAVLTHGVTRTLVTQLGASVHFSYETFMSSDFQYVAENAGVIYISGYFLRVCMQTVRKVAETAVSKNLPVVFNLNAVWVVENFYDQIKEVLPYVDYVIANELETEAMSRILKLKSNDVFETGKWISKFSKISNASNRAMLITRGEDSLIVIQGEQTFLFPTVSVPTGMVIDTNGAGDAFAGGFLAGLSKHDGLSECVKCGLWAASEIVQQVGCNFRNNTLNDFITTEARHS